MQEEIILVDSLLRGLLKKDQEAAERLVGIEKESPIVRALCCGSLLAMAIHERKRRRKMNKYAVMVYPCGDYDVFEIKGLLVDFLPQILGGPVKRVSTHPSDLAAFMLADTRPGEYNHAAWEIGTDDLPWDNVVFLHKQCGIARGFTYEQLRNLIDNRLEPAKLVEKAYRTSNCDICSLTSLCEGINCRGAWRTVVDTVRMLNSHRGTTAELVILEGCEPWRDAIADPPGPLDLLDNNEFIVTIRAAANPTTLFCSDEGAWVDEYGDVYAVTHWMPMPGRPNE